MTAGILESVGPDELDQAISEGGVLLVDFWAAWCGPCHAMKPILTELAAERADRIRVADVDVATFPSLGEHYGVQTLPTFIIFADGRVKTRLVGARTKRQLIRSLHDVTESPT